MTAAAAAAAAAEPSLEQQVAAGGRSKLAAAAAAAGAAAPSAAKSTGGKAAAEVVPLTPEQRQQLLETCKQVKWASVSLGWQCLAAHGEAAAIPGGWPASKQPGSLTLFVASIDSACMGEAWGLRCSRGRCWRKAAAQWFERHASADMAVGDPRLHALLPRHLVVQELPLLEVELGVRPDLSSHLEGDGKKPLDLKQKVRLAGMCGEGCSREHTACMLIN